MVVQGSVGLQGKGNTGCISRIIFIPQNTVQIKNSRKGALAKLYHFLNFFKFFASLPNLFVHFYIIFKYFFIDLS